MVLGDAGSGNLNTGQRRGGQGDRRGNTRGEGVRGGENERRGRRGGVLGYAGSGNPGRRLPVTASISKDSS